MEQGENHQADGCRLALLIVCFLTSFVLSNPRMFDIRFILEQHNGKKNVFFTK